MPEVVRTKESYRMRTAVAASFLGILALSACGGNGEDGQEVRADEGKSPTAATATETPQPVSCEDEGKYMLDATDPFCEPAPNEQLAFALNAEKLGWHYDDPLAVYQAQQSLGVFGEYEINTVEDPLDFELESRVGSAEKHLNVHDISYTKEVRTLQQASEAYNLLLPTLDKLTNDLIQYKAGVAPEELGDHVTDSILGDSRHGTAFDWLITEIGHGPIYDDEARFLFNEQITSLVDRLGPNQVVRFVGAATTQEENMTYFEDMNEVSSSKEADQSLELTGIVKVGVTTYQTTADGIVTDTEYIDFLAPNQQLVLFIGPAPGGVHSPGDTVRLGIHGLSANIE